MSARVMVAVGLLMLILLPLRAGEDYLAEAQQQDSPFVKNSSDHRVKATILYVGPMKAKLLDYVFAITYLVEDCGSDHEYEHNVADNPAPPGRVSPYDLFPAAIEVKDGAHNTVPPPGGNYWKYKEALASTFTADYPDVKLPKVEHPDRARIYQCFYNTTLTGPFDITLHDYIPAYGQNSFHFRDVAVGSFPFN